MKLLICVVVLLLLPLLTCGCVARPVRTIPTQCPPPATAPADLMQEPPPPGYFRSKLDATLDPGSTAEPTKPTK